MQKACSYNDQPSLSPEPSEFAKPARSQGNVAQANNAFQRAALRTFMLVTVVVTMKYGKSSINCNDGEKRFLEAQV